MSTWRADFSSSHSVQYEASSLQRRWLWVKWVCPTLNLAQSTSVYPSFMRIPHYLDKNVRDRFQSMYFSFIYPGFSFWIRPVIFRSHCRQVSNNWLHLPSLIHCLTYIFLRWGQWPSCPRALSIVLRRLPTLLLCPVRGWWVISPYATHWTGHYQWPI